MTGKRCESAVFHQSPEASTLVKVALAASLGTIPGAKARARTVVVSAMLNGAA